MRRSTSEPQRGTGTGAPLAGRVPQCSTSPAGPGGGDAAALRVDRRDVLLDDLDSDGPGSCGSRCRCSGRAGSGASATRPGRRALARAGGNLVVALLVQTLRELSEVPDTVTGSLSPSCCQWPISDGSFTGLGP